MNKIWVSNHCILVSHCVTTFWMLNQLMQDIQVEDCTLCHREKDFTELLESPVMNGNMLVVEEKTSGYDMCDEFTPVVLHTRYFV